MRIPERVVVDTSALYAVLNKNDQFHGQAGPLLESLLNFESELWITSYALVETIALVERRLGKPMVKRMLEAMKDALNVFFITPSFYAKIQVRYLGEDTTLSFVDWSCIVLGEDLHAPVFTFDPLMPNRWPTI
jgi:predicted nucleic acid-binding protein